MTKEAMYCIDLEATLAAFGYHATSLSPGSNYRVMARCIDCPVTAPARSVIRKRLRDDYRCPSHANSKPDVIKQARDTRIERYGTFAPPEQLAARNATLKAHYGEAGAGAPEIIAKRKASIAARFGEQGLSAPEVQAKKRETIARNHGPEGLAAESITKKKKATVLAKYGEEGLANETTSARKQATAHENFGALGFAHPSITAKKKATLRKNFGALGGKHPDIIAKARTTVLEKFGETGVPHAPQRWGVAATELKTLVEQWTGRPVVTDKPLPSGRAIDIVVPEHKLGIEYNGLYWHNEHSPQPRGRTYHHTKYQEAREAGLRLITIFEDEWLKHRYAVESFLRSVVGSYALRIGARECDLLSVATEDAKAFLHHEHIQGAPVSILAAWGLYSKGAIQGVITLSPHHRNADASTRVLSRLCFRSGVQVVGGASRLNAALLAYARENGATRVVSWSDNRWSVGGVYSAMGYVREKEYGPDYAYVTVRNPKERFSKQSQKKSRTGCPADSTELEWATEHGLARIWDCGKIRWVKTL